MAEANVRRRGTGDPEATLDTSQSTLTAALPKTQPTPAQTPPAAVLPRGTINTEAREPGRSQRLSVCAVRPGDTPEEGSPMVAARRNLLREIRRLAVRDELRAMRTRGRLVVPPAVLPPQAPSSADCQAPRDHPERK
jgi:hypothetical protein